MRREFLPENLGNRTLLGQTFDDAIVIEHRFAVGGEPDVRFETGRTESNREDKGFDGVFASVRTGTAMSETNWWADESSHSCQRTREPPPRAVATSSEMVGQRRASVHSRTGKPTSNWDYGCDEACNPFHPRRVRTNIGPPIQLGSDCLRDVPSGSMFPSQSAYRIEFGRFTKARTPGVNMTKIRARCPECGDVEFGIDRIVVIGTPTTACAYRFVCPGCGDPVSRTAVPDVIELLLSAGVLREAFEHPSITRARTPLQESDVDAFRELLKSGDWFESLRSSIE